VSFGGKEFAPLYTPKNDTLLNLFQITQDEQRQLRTIIGADMAAERHKTREKARRRQAGAVDRETYESRSAARTRPWEALGMSRRSWYRAGKPGAPADGTSPT
ncbi:replication protein, partial [Xanthomonas citri pv. citri]|nr:replication protein [Xanthomonas citri pv. citri]